MVRIDLFEFRLTVISLTFQFDMSNLVTRCSTADSYSIMTKYRLNRPGATQRAKSAHVSRVRGNVRSDRPEEHLRVECTDIRSVTPVTDMYDFDKDFPDDLDLEGR